MCGYCIESGVILDFIESEQTPAPVKLENNWVSIYLQESADLTGMIDKTKGFGNFEYSVDIVFCRLYEQYIAQGHNVLLYNLMASTFGQELISNFLAKSAGHYGNEIWDALANPRLYADKQRWDEFIQNNQSLLIEQSAECLKSYCDWWILGNNKEISDPDQRMAETGIMDPIEDTTPRDWKKFYSIFPILYFALSLFMQTPNSHRCYKVHRIESHA